MVTGTGTNWVSISIVTMILDLLLCDPSWPKKG